jgi:hypothetical protein
MSDRRLRWLAHGIVSCPSGLFKGASNVRIHGLNTLEAVTERTHHISVLWRGGGGDEAVLRTGSICAVGRSIRERFGLALGLLLRPGIGKVQWRSFVKTVMNRRVVGNSFPG